MTLAFVVDMNLSTEWLTELASVGFPSVHWSQVGDPKATDQEIMAWALANSKAVFTHDLDFGNILALTKATGPSVVQLRGDDVLPDKIAATVIGAIQAHQNDLETGALLVIDMRRARLRLLPF